MATVDRLPQLLAKLGKMPDSAKLRMAESLHKNADELLEAQKALAQRHRRSGKTLASLQKRQGEHELQVVVFSDYWGARFEEFGTVKTPPIPFFFPAYRLLKKKFKTRSAGAARKAVKEVSRGGK